MNSRLHFGAQTLAFLGLALMTAAAAYSQEGAEPAISSKTLDNGLEVIVVENHALPLTTIEIAVKNGAFTEPPEFDGLAHLYEHMFFKGNAVIPDQARYMDRLNELGARWNGTTSTERVNYYMTVHKKNLREGMEFLRDAVRYPLFTDAELAKERAVVLGEFDRNEADPSFHLHRELQRKLWRKYFSRKNTLGDRETIAKATREQMRTIQKRYYVPNNSALLVAGDAAPEKVFALAEYLYGDWERGDDPFKRWPIPQHPPLKQTERIVVAHDDVQTVQLNLAWHGPSMTRDTASTFAADVFSFILAQSDSQFQKALKDAGLVDAVSLSYYSQKHTGPITLSAATSADRLDAAYAAILAEIDKFDDPDYITDEQIRSAKNMLEVEEIFSRERASDFVHSLSFWWATGGLDYYLDYLDNLRAVRRGDLERYVKRYIQGKPRIEAALVNGENLDEIAFDASAEIIRPTSGTSETAIEQTGTELEVATEEFDVDGLNVVLRSNPASEIVVAELVLVGGLPYYGKERAGHELVLLQALDKGSRNYSKEEVNRQLARTGSSISADAAYDYSTLTLRTLRRDLEENFAIFADAVAHPLLAPKEVDLVVEQQLSAIRRRMTQPDSLISVLGSRNFYKDHPYEVPPWGTEETVQGLTAEDIERLHDELIFRDRLRLFIVGDLTREEATELIAQGLADVPQGEFDRPLIGHDAPEEPRLLLEERDIPTNYVFGTFDAPNHAHEDYYALQVGLSILRDRFFREVRTKRNLSYAVAALMSARYANYGVLYVTSVKPNEALRVMYDEVDRLRREPVDEKILNDKIEEMITRDLMSNQDSASQLNRLIVYEMNGAGWEAADEAIERMRELTPAEVRAAAERCLQNISYAVLGDPEKIDPELFTSR